MNVLDEYFILFDEARYSEESFHKLNELFHDDIEFVLNKKTFKGKEAWKQFVKSVYTTNKDLKHMYNGWTQNEDGSYETDWVICGNRYETGVYTQEGKDIARLDENGKIIYLENQPKDDQLFSNQ
ncbi:nuclear transport factor 2 family protein [Staphylococcus sp. GDY8P145P]|uniref:nuclear transport factor 2 family protein n=1 Tax=Mammaliicoccus sciuri TaxID=1296 RepID=UPI00194DC048